jgi:tRNA (adenine57-N1/adenine58-N1)-methyltransferase
MQTVEALERAAVFGLIETYETLLRTWNIQGRSVRPDHRMVAHSGFITVARKVEAGFWRGGSQGTPPNDEDEQRGASPTFGSGGSGQEESSE